MRKHSGLLLLFLALACSCRSSQPPFKVDKLFDQAQPATLGLSFAPGRETFSIFEPDSSGNRYNHGVVLFPFQGVLYAQWQSSATDEDGPDTRVFYSRTEDGAHWSAPMPLTEPRGGGITTSGGWWSDGETLVAYLCVWPGQGEGPKQGHTEYRTSMDGLAWSERKPVLDAAGKPVLGIIEQDVHALPGGRLLTAFHRQPGLIVTPYFTDNPLGVTGWTAGRMDNLPAKNSAMSRELEPAWFYRKDGTIVMVFRDQNSTFKKLAATSKDQGQTWTTPMVIDTPDSRAKQSAGNLPDGTAFMVSNPSGSKDRFPLVVTLSNDGFRFDRAFLLRAGGADLQPQRFDGKYKRAGYSYPKSVVWGDYLYVGYATNKEDVEVTRVLVRDLR